MTLHEFAEFWKTVLIRSLLVLGLFFLVVMSLVIFADVGRAQQQTIVEAHNVSMSNTQSITSKNGEEINITRENATVISIKRCASGTATTCYLYSNSTTLATATLYGSATYSGSTCTIVTPFVLNKSSSYMILDDSGGGAYTECFNVAASTPVAGTYVTWLSGIAGSAGPSVSHLQNDFFEIESITINVTAPPIEHHLLSPLNNTFIDKPTNNLLLVTINETNSPSTNVWYNATNDAQIFCTNHTTGSSVQNISCGIPVTYGTQVRLYVNDTKGSITSKFGVWNWTINPQANISILSLNATVLSNSSILLDFAVNGTWNNMSMLRNGILAFQSTNNTLTSIIDTNLQPDTSYTYTLGFTGDLNTVKQNVTARTSKNTVPEDTLILRQILSENKKSNEAITMIWVILTFFLCLAIIIVTKNPIYIGAFVIPFLLAISGMSQLFESTGDSIYLIMQVVFLFLAVLSLIGAGYFGLIYPTKKKDDEEKDERNRFYGKKVL